MKRSIRRDLGLQLLAFYLLFVGPVVLATLVFDRLSAQRLQADVKAADLSLSRAIAQESNTVMDGALQAVRQLGAYPEVIAADPAGMEPLFRTLLTARPDINLIYRLDAHGIMVYHYPTGPGSTVGWDFSGRGYFQRALTTRNPLLSTGRISPTTEQPVATAVMPLWSDDGRFLGVVATNIKLQFLSHTLASIASEHRPDEGFQVAIIDSAGQVIAHPNPPALLAESSRKPAQVTQAVLNGQSGNLIMPDSSGKQMLFSYVPIPSAGWGVIVDRPTAAAFATVSATHQGVLFIIAVFLVVGLFFWVALSRRVLQPLETLTAYSRTIGLEQEISGEQHKSLERLSRRPDQIGDLIRSLNRMEEAIAARLQELSTLLEISASVVSTLDTQTVLNRILEQVERLMGVQMCAIVALDESRGVFRARASRGLSQRYIEHLAINPSEPLSVTLRAIRSGEAIQVSDTETDASFSALRPRARAEGYRSLVAVPLSAQHTPPSALLVYRPDPHSYSQREINLLTNFANQAAMAIENATLYARSDMRLNEQTRRLEALIQSLQDGLILEDLQGRVLYANRRIGELVELPLEDISGVPVASLIERLVARSVENEAGEQASLRQQIEHALDGSGPRSLEMALMFNHQVRYLRLLIFNVTASDGMPIGSGQILRDITQVREVDRMKSSLISTVSHELRTPLAAIKGYATTLLAKDVQWDNLTQQEFLSIISDETDRLSSLVNDLLDMSRIDAGNLIVSKVACSLEELVYRAAQRAHPQPGEHLQLNLPADLPVFFADPQRIEAVLRNLIENAAKYAGEDSPISISAGVEAGNLVVRVADEGPGIPAEERERIFDSFYQLENGLNRKSTGAGLGLAICRGFVIAHGGKIWVESRPKGACIAFSLPMQGSLEAAASPRTG
jgi:signal transduction histidine kinase